MKVTQDMIEQAVVDKVMAGEKARYLLVDRKSYDEFCKSFQPIEKLEGVPMDYVQKNSEAPEIKKYYSQGADQMLQGVDGVVEFIPVDTEKDLFEVVG